MIDLIPFACSTCRVTMIQGGGDAASWSIFFLLIVVVGLLACVGFFMARIVRRGIRHHDPQFDDTWSPGGPHS